MTGDPASVPVNAPVKSGSTPRPRPSRLHSGGAVTLEQTTKIAGRRKSRLIVLAGPVASGKTTIVAAIYESFHSGPFAGQVFGGSATLVALEQRCHEGRLASGLEIPTTARTSRTQIGDLVHLTVSPEAAPLLGDIFINDVTGEFFGAIVRRPSAAAEMAVLAKADRVAITLDGLLLLDRDRRDLAVYESQILARAIVEHGMLKPEARVDIVVTKLDKIMENGGNADYARAVAADVSKAVTAAFRGEIILTCARSEVAGPVRSGKSVDDLFKLWVADRPERHLGVPGVKRRRAADTRPRDASA